MEQQVPNPEQPKRYRSWASLLAGVIVGGGGLFVAIGSLLIPLMYPQEYQSPVRWVREILLSLSGVCLFALGVCLYRRRHRWGPPPRSAQAGAALPSAGERAWAQPPLLDFTLLSLGLLLLGGCGLLDAFGSSQTGRVVLPAVVIILAGSGYAVFLWGILKKSA